MNCSICQKPIENKNRKKKMTTKDTSKYSNLIRNKKIEIYLPNLEKLKAAVSKDINKLDIKIEIWQSKLNLRDISDVEKYKSWIGQSADFAIIII